MGFTPAQIEDGVVRYLDKELMPMLPVEGFQRVLAGTAVAVVLRRYQGQLGELAKLPILKELAVVDSTGSYDVKMIAEEFKKQMPEKGLEVEVPMVGKLTFHKEDVDKLLSYIQQK